MTLGAARLPPQPLGEVAQPRRADGALPREVQPCATAGGHAQPRRAPATAVRMPRVAGEPKLVALRQAGGPVPPPPPGPQGLSQATRRTDAPPTITTPRRLPLVEGGQPPTVPRGVRVVHVRHAVVERGGQPRAGGLRRPRCPPAAPKGQGQVDRHHLLRPAAVVRVA